MNDRAPVVPHPSILEVRTLTRHFGGLVAVNQVSFTVQEYEIFGLIGPNGAGKTTLFNMITVLIPPSSGELRFQNTPLTQKRPHQIAARGIARTFQNLRLFGNLSVLDNVSVARHIHSRTTLMEGLLGAPQAKLENRYHRQKAMDLLELVGLADRATQEAKTLAYGDQRRLEIARALALEPRILLLDEPAAGMNPSEKSTLSELIRTIRDQFHLTVLLIEHHVPLVMGLCDRIAVLHFGQLIALGEPDVVRTNPAVIEAYLGDT